MKFLITNVLIFLICISSAVYAQNSEIIRNNTNQLKVQQTFTYVVNFVDNISRADAKFIIENISNKSITKKYFNTQEKYLLIISKEEINTQEISKFVNELGYKVENCLTINISNYEKDLFVKNANNKISINKSKSYIK